MEGHLKYFSAGMSLLALIVVLAYVRYNEDSKKGKVSRDISTTFGAIGGRGNANVNAKTLPLPEKLEFAGEEVPLDRPEVRERLYRELLVNTYWHSNTLLLIAEANRWLPSIEKILIDEDVPADFKYLPVIEGSLRNDVSFAGAVGFWQFLEATAKENGLEVRDHVDERYDPLKSTKAAASYLKKSYEKFNNWTDVAASYNRGMAGLSRAMENQKTDNYYDLFLNEETTRYVYRILAIKLILENPEKYGFVIDRDHLFYPIPTKKIEVTESISDLPQFAIDQGISYGRLKYYNPWIRDYELRVPKGKTYEILIPKEEE